MYTHVYSGTCESCYIRSCMMYMSPGEEQQHAPPESIVSEVTTPDLLVGEQHTPDSTISEDTTPDLSVGEQPCGLIVMCIYCVNLVLVFTILK